MSKFFLIAFSIFFIGCSKTDPSEPDDYNPPEESYFPPTNSTDWETLTVTEAGFNENTTDDLYNFLNEKNTKAFIILKNGRIVIEYYFDDFNENSIWYWASAGKTLTATLTGIAEDEGFLDITDKVSDYLGSWTSLPTDKEDLITCRHLLTMTSGIDDTSGNDVTSSNLEYTADAGTRWAYHNVYVKLQDVVATATNQSWSDYFGTKLKNPIGMTGAWNMLDNLSVYWSNARSMARFGILIANKGNWDGLQIVSEHYIEEATTTSQDINKAYGYLWWLNGKASYHLPQSQTEFSGSLIETAPEDMFAALGKNDQKLYIVPSKDLIIVRLGQSADGTNFALSDFDAELWTKINAVIN